MLYKPTESSKSYLGNFHSSLGCGGRLTSPTGAIATPGYPQKYPRNTACVWTINVPDSNSIIELKFDSFMLENHPNCQKTDFHIAPAPVKEVLTTF